MAFEDNIRDDVRLKFSTYIDDIRYQKGQQWKIIYLTLLALGGIISLAIAMKDILSDSSNFTYLLYVITFFITLLGLFYIVHYHKAMIRSRKGKDAIQKNYLNRSLNNQKPLKPEDSGYMNYSERPKCYEYCTKEVWSFVLPFCGLIFLTSILAFFIIRVISLSCG